MLNLLRENLGLVLVVVGVLWVARGAIRMASRWASVKRIQGQWAYLPRSRRKAILATWESAAKPLRPLAREPSDGETEQWLNVVLGEIVSSRDDRLLSVLHWYVYGGEIGQPPMPSCLERVSPEDGKGFYSDPARRASMSI